MYFPMSSPFFLLVTSSRKFRFYVASLLITDGTQWQSSTSSNCSAYATPRCGLPNASFPQRTRILARRWTFTSFMFGWDLCFLCPATLALKIKTCDGPSRQSTCLTVPPLPKSIHDAVAFFKSWKRSTTKTRRHCCSSSIVFTRLWDDWSLQWSLHIGVQAILAFMPQPVDELVVK